MAESRRNSSLAPGLLSVALFFMALNFIGTILARYSRDLGISIAATGAIWSVLSLVSFFMRPFSGYLADRLNSYVSMSLGGAFLAISSLIYAASRGAAGLLAGRVVQGLAIAFFIAPSIAVIAVAAGGYAGMALGYRSMVIALSSLIAPPLAGFLTDTIGYGSVFAAAILLSVILVAVDSLLARREGSPEARRSRVEWRRAINGIVLMMALTATLGGAGFFAVGMLVQSHYRDLGYEASIYGYFMMFSGLGGLVSRYLGGRLSMSRNPAYIAVAGYLLTAASIALLRTMYLAPASYLVALLFGFGFGLGIPPQQLIVIRAVPEGVKNTAASVFAMGFDMGGFTGPLIYGYLASQLGYVESYGYVALAPLLALVPLLAVAKHIGGQQSLGTR